MFKNFYKMLVGGIWGFIFSDIIGIIGDVSSESIFTGWDAVWLVLFVILMGAMSVITYLEIVE